jgi:DNA-binding transcriptional MocR family regulator
MIQQAHYMPGDRLPSIAEMARRFGVGHPTVREALSIILIPCRVVRRARSITLRLIGYQPTLVRLFSAWNTIERTGFT